MENTIEFKLRLDGSDNAAIEKAVTMLQALLGEPVADAKAVREMKVTADEVEAPKKKAATKKEAPKADEAPKKEAPKAEEAEPPKKKADTKKEPEPVDDIDTQSETAEAHSWTKDDLRAKWAEVRDNSATDHRDEVKAKLIELGGTSITNLPDDRVNEFYEFLESLD